MIESLLLFKKEIENTSISEDFVKVNKEAIKAGFIVTEKACTKDVLKFIKMQSINPNATFYSSWQEIFSKTRFELFVDQVKHYLSTYGSNFEDIPYIPNEGTADIPRIENLVVINTITQEEAAERLNKMIQSGIALKSETVNQIMQIFKGLRYVFTESGIALVKNREVKLKMYEEYKIKPKNPIELIKFIVYKATGSTLVIKNPETIQKCKESGLNLNDYIDENNIKQIASIFLRFKPIFLAFKNQSVNKSLINKLRKLAKTYHKPMVQSYWDRCITTTPDLTHELADSLTNFKKISLIEEILIRQCATTPYTKPYIIRNGKLFMKERTLPVTKIYPYGLYNSLIKSLNKKACRVKLPKNIEMVLPRSEKSFIGDYPLYTNIKIKEGSVVGIYWRSEWGAEDLDLSFVTNKNKFGWNGSYHSEDSQIAYSGDMTTANPEATELLLFRKDFSDTGIVKVNLFSGEEGSQFNLFVAKMDSSTRLETNYMVDPNNILFNVHTQMDSKEKCLAIITKGSLYLAELRTGSKHVSETKDITTAYAEYVAGTANCHIYLKETLSDAGFIIVDETEECDLDLSNPTKDQIIDLLS